MHRWGLVAVPIAILLWVGAAGAANLSKVDRTIQKEPAYQSKPKYCLLVFGPEAKHRIWLVLDGDTLYVDKNGNGDLSEEGEKVQPSRALLTGWLRPGDKEPKALTYSCAVGKDLQIRVLTINDNYVQVDVKDVLQKLDFCASRDAQGPLKFAEPPKAAPIIYCGPLTFLLAGEPVFKRGDKAADFTVHIGRPGLGAGTSTTINVAAVPEHKHPVAKIEFPHKDDAGRSVQVEVTLDHRC